MSVCCSLSEITDYAIVWYTLAYVLPLTPMHLIMLVNFNVIYAAYETFYLDIYEQPQPNFETRTHL